MKKFFLAGVLLAFAVSSCGGPRFLASPEESGLNLQKISDESKNSVVGARANISHSVSVKNTFSGNSRSFVWNSTRSLSISPDGESLAYLSLVNERTNIMARRISSTGVSTQRTFRDAQSCAWGVDGSLYYSNYVGTSYSNYVRSGNYLYNEGTSYYQVESVGATSGTLMRQLTSSNHDNTPILSADGETLYFVRFDNIGTSVWLLDMKSSNLTCCSTGYMPYPIGSGKEEYVCVRNTPSGRSEIWQVNFVSGQETLLVSDKEKGFSNPCVSKDGKWIVFEGMSKSSASKKWNVDIYAMRMDGSNMMQLTYHPGTDCSPVWSADGKTIYFISSRGSRDSSFNIWKMNFPC